MGAESSNRKDQTSLSPYLVTRNVLKTSLNAKVVKIRSLVACHNHYSSKAPTTSKIEVELCESIDPLWKIQRV